MISCCNDQLSNTIPPMIQHATLILIQDTLIVKKTIVNFTSDNNCVKAIDAKTKNSACCVLPFIYKGVQYETCTDENHNQPWCSLTENFDLEEKWGDCVGMCEYLRGKRIGTETKTTRQT